MAGVDAKLKYIDNDHVWLGISHRNWSVVVMSQMNHIRQVETAIYHLEIRLCDD